MPAGSDRSPRPSRGRSRERTWSPFGKRHPFAAVGRRPITTGREPLTLARMRYRGVPSIGGRGETGGHEARILVDMLADELPVSEVARTLKCSVCGSKNV